MKNIKKTKFIDYIIGVIFTFLFLSFAVIFTFNFKPLYYWDIDILGIENISGLSKQDIIDNYNAVIDFSSPFNGEDFNLPSLPSSPEGTQHFIDVKKVIMIFYYILFLTLPICAAVCIYKRNKKDYQYLYATFITAMTIPFFSAIILYINFQKAFIIFHEIFFKNDYWLLDRNVDPIIDIFPHEFFMHCIILIVLLLILSSLSSYFLYKKFSSRK